MKQIKSQNTRPGFTVIELTITLAIISVLIVVISMLVSGIISSYTRGVTVKNVNATGRELIEDFSTTISSSRRKDVKDICSTLFAYEGEYYNSCKDDGAYRYIYSERYANGKPISGVFCTGTYSYIWNTGYAVPDSDNPSERPATIKYNSQNSADLELKDFRLVRFTDQSNVACLSRTKNPSTGERGKLYAPISDSVSVYDLTHDSNNIDYILENAPEELLQKNDTDLILYDLEVFRPAQDYPTFHAYYTGHFVLGTTRGGVNIMSNGDYCKPPSDYESDFDYCSVNKFNFAAEAIGG